MNEDCCFNNATEKIIIYGRMKERIEDCFGIGGHGVEGLRRLRNGTVCPDFRGCVMEWAIAVLCYGHGDRKALLLVKISFPKGFTF